MYKTHSSFPRTSISDREQIPSESKANTTKPTRGQQKDNKSEMEVNRRSWVKDDAFFVLCRHCHCRRRSRRHRGHQGTDDVLKQATGGLKLSHRAGAFREQGWIKVQKMKRENLYTIWNFSDIWKFDSCLVELWSSRLMFWFTKTKVQHSKSSIIAEKKNSW